MRFFAEHRFAHISLADFERLFFEEAFNEAMCQAVCIERHLEVREQTDSLLTRTVLIHPDRQVPGPIATLTGNAKIGYRERLEYEFARHQGRFTCESTVLADRVSTAGTLELVADGDDVIRRVTGDVSVKAFGVGKIVERFIVSDVEKGYEDAATFTQRYLRDQQGS